MPGCLDHSSYGFLDVFLLWSVRNYRKKEGVLPWGLQKDVVYLGWPIAPSYLSPNAGGGGVAGSQPMITAVHRSTNKLCRSNYILKNCKSFFHHIIGATLYCYCIVFFNKCCTSTTPDVSLHLWHDSADMADASVPATLVLIYSQHHRILSDITNIFHFWKFEIF